MANRNTKRNRQQWRDEVLKPLHAAGEKYTPPPRKSGRHNYENMTLAFRRAGGYGN